MAEPEAHPGRYGSVAVGRGVGGVFLPVLLDVRHFPTGPALVPPLARRTFEKKVAAATLAVVAVDDLSLYGCHERANVDLAEASRLAHCAEQPRQMFILLRLRQCVLLAHAVRVQTIAAC